jgi:hypothetical protein
MLDLFNFFNEMESFRLWLRPGCGRGAPREPGANWQQTCRPMSIALNSASCMGLGSEVLFGYRVWACTS